MSAEKTLPFPLVQANWKKAMTLEGDQAFGHNFYKNLFIDHPALKETIFKGVSIESQKVNLPKSITTVLGILDDLPRALGALAALGRRHVRYATPDAGYAVVGANLIKTLGQILGSDFTEESKAEWIALYGIIEKTMIDACYTEAAIPDWKFISKRRATEFKTLILAPAAGKLDKFADSVSVATKGNFSSVLGNTAVIDEAIEKQSTAPIRAAGLRLAKEGKAKKENFAGLADAIASNIAGKSSANPYEKMVIDWFVLHLQAGFEGEAFDLSNPLGKKEAADAAGALPFPLVQANWKKAMTLEGDQAFGHNFYKNLFADHPALKETLFKGVSIESQKVNLPKSITTVLGILDDLPRALGALAALGRRHVRYATPDAGYAVVGANLIKTLGQILGSDFTEESKAEWIALYGIIEKTMVDACYTEAAIPDWKFISKRRATEFKTLILAPAAGKLDKFADSVSLATKGNFSSVLGNTAVIDEAIEKQSTAPIRAAGLRLAKEGKAKKENFAGLADAIASNIAGKSSANPYEKMVIDWFVLHLQAGFDGEAFDLSNPLGKKEAADAGVSSCSSCDILTSVGFVALAAAAGAAAWYFLKKK